jgi:hypothetical protein
MLARHLTVALLWLGGIAAAGPGPLSAQTRSGTDCVTIGTPKPTLGYTYQHKDSNGAVSEYTTYWEEVTPTGSRHRTVLGKIVTVQVDQHHIEADVSVIDATTSSGADGRVISKTTFRPGVVADPAFRACAGRSWPIPASTAVHSSAGMNASAPTPAGTLTIVAIREAVTVPAGRFDTVRYTRTTMTPAGKSVDEYWKAIDQGVVVKHTATLPNGGATEVLQSIR